MSEQGIDKVTKSVEFDEKDVKGLIGMIKNKGLFTDVFLILSWGALIMFFIMFILTFVSVVPPKYIEVLGYALVIIIFIMSVRENYNHITTLLRDDNMCTAEYYIESESRLKTSLSFLYLYLRTYVVALINIGILFVVMYIVHVAFRSNILYDRATFRGLSQYGIIALFFAVIYLLLSLLMAVMMVVLYVGHVIGIKSLKNKFKLKLGQIALIFLVFGIGIIFWCEIVSSLWVRIMSSSNFMSLFAHDDLFRSVDFTHDDTGRTHLVMVLQMALVGVVYCIFAVPRFNSVEYCDMIQTYAPEDDEYDPVMAENATKFRTRFVFGYFVICCVLIVMHLKEMIKTLITK
jgi:hypothetical protein